MVSKKQITWAELRVGLLTLASLFILAVGIFYITGAGGFWVPRYRLRTYLPEAAGLRSGAPVRVAGVEVGWVERVGISADAADPTRTVEILLRLDRRYQGSIRTDSHASLATEGLLGERVVEIKRGATGTVIPPNGEVPGLEETSIKRIVQRTDEVMSNLSVLSSKLNTIVTKVESGRGTIAQLINDDTIYRRINASVSDIQTMSAKAARGEGSLGKLMASNELYDKTNNTLTRLDNITANIRDGKGTLGKLIYDPSAYDKANDLVKRADAIVTDVEEGRGTLGKLVKDEKLYEDAQATFSNLSRITGRVDKGEGSAGKFFNDPRLYENFNDLTVEFNGLVTDFRKNPNRFLRIKLLSLF